MPDTNDTELRERVVRLETKQEHHDDQMQSLSERMDALQDSMNRGFETLSQQVRRMNDWRTWAAFGVVVGATSVGNAIWHIVVRVL